MNYFKIIPKLIKLYLLEIYVFITFLAICALINGLIVNVSNPHDFFYAFLVGLFKVGTSFLLVAIWLISWYYITKKMIKQK